MSKKREIIKITEEEAEAIWSDSNDDYTHIRNYIVDEDLDHGLINRRLIIERSSDDKLFELMYSQSSTNNFYDIHHDDGICLKEVFAKNRVTTYYE